MRRKKVLFYKTKPIATGEKTHIKRRKKVAIVGSGENGPHACIAYCSEVGTYLFKEGGGGGGGGWEEINAVPRITLLPLQVLPHAELNTSIQIHTATHHA